MAQILIGSRYQVRSRVRLSGWLLAGMLCLLLACGGEEVSTKPEPSASEPQSGERTRVAASGHVRFTDVTLQAGLDFEHDNGASERRYLPETMGSGVAFFDYDGDGWADLFLVNSGPIEGEASPPALYRNLGDGHFEETTEAAGLALPFHGLGTAVGDLDNDGDLDLFVSGLSGDQLFLNRGNGTFIEVGSEFGLSARGLGSSAAFLDYDADGWLDLFVGRYLDWQPEKDRICRPDGVHPSYCTPELYPAVANQLFRNLEGQAFEEVSAVSGIDSFAGKALGVVTLDHNLDGWPDLAVANDTVRNFLFVNQGDGTFEELGEETALAYSFSGATRGAMGIDAGDLDGDGRDDIVIGNFSQEMVAVYRATASGLYSDDAGFLNVGLPTLMTLAFGTLIFDVDLDGWLDILIANGHIEPDIARFQPQQSFAQPAQLFWNRSGKSFEPVLTDAEPLSAGWVARGLATADYDGDGDLDLVLTQNGGSARLWRNDSQAASWIRLRLMGRASNRTGYGAVVTVTAGGRTWSRRLSSGRSYLSASEPILTLGLGEATDFERLEVLWPSGKVQHLDRLELGRLHVVEEPY